MSEQPQKHPEEKTEQGSPAGSGSGGGSAAGKSFAVMQDRLLTQPQAQQAATSDAQQQVASQPDQTSAPVVTNPPPGGKPKGKDFEAMSMRAPAPAATAAPSEPSPGQQGGRPKGKDFAAMANRRPSPPSVPAPGAPGLTPEQARAAQMQAAARAAAGLPPLDVPTATSVTTNIPPISVPPLTGTATAAVTQAPVPSPNAAAIANKARQDHMAKVKAAEAARVAAATRALAPSQAHQRRPSGASTPATATDAPPPPSTKPTSQPTLSESRLQGSANTAPLTGQRMQDLLTSVDPNYTLDTEAEQQLLLMADDFLDKVTRQSIRLAQHRGSKTMDVQDVQLALSKQWGIVVPGLGAPTLKPSKPAGRVAASGGAKRKASDGGGRAKKPSAGISIIAAQGGNNAAAGGTSTKVGTKS